VQVPSSLINTFAFIHILIFSTSPVPIPTNSIALNNFLASTGFTSLTTNIISITNLTDTLHTFTDTIITIFIKASSDLIKPAIATHQLDGDTPLRPEHDLRWGQGLLQTLQKF
jgi:hypothetical protein